MPTLSSAIVKNGVATMREVEEALARQVLYGGDLATNLLELAAVKEDALTSVVAAELDLEPAPAGELPRVSTDVLSLVPGDVALRHGVYPLSSNEGRLTIAVSEPLPGEVEQDLSFALGMDLTQHIAPLVRIRQAITRDYHLPLDRRFLRLVAKLEGKPDPSPSSRPAMSADAPDLAGLPRPPTVPPMGYPPATELESAPPAPPEPTTGGAAEAGAARAPKAPRVPSDLEAIRAEQQPAAYPPSATGQPPPARASSVSQQMPSVDRARWAAATKARGAKRPSLKPRHRGPYTAAMAEEDLFSAESRDEVLSAFFDFACQFFDYAALFAVQSDIAEGRDAHGPGASPAQISGIGVPLDLPGSLQRVKNEATQPLVKLATDGLDARLAKDLQRYVGATVLLLPIRVRGRCVLILWGDDGKQAVELDGVGEVIAFAPLVSRALEHVILRRKQAARRAAGIEQGALPRSPLSRRRQSRRGPAKSERAAALFEALDVSSGDLLADSDFPHASASAREATPPGPPPSTPAGEERAPDSVIPSRTIAVEGDPPATAANPSLRELSSELPAPVDTEPVDAGWDVVAETVTTPGFGAHEGATKPGVGSALERRPAEPPPSTPAKSGRKLELVPERDEPTAAPGASVEDSPEISVGAALLDEVLPTETEQDVRRAGEAPLAPGSRRIAVGPREPGRQYRSREMKLPSVIVEDESNLKPLAKRLAEGDTSVEAEIVRAGAAGAASMIEHFPGKLTADLKRDTPSHPAPASECGALLNALVKIGAAAAPFVASRTRSDDPDVRAWACRLLGEIPAEVSAIAVLECLFDDDPHVRRAAVAGAQLIGSDESSRATVQQGLCALARTAEDAQDRIAAIEILAEIRSRGAVPALIELIETSQKEVAEAAQWALTLIGRQDFGDDTSRWRRWWDRAERRHRVEWLIDSLVHETAEIRRAAGEELKTLTKEYFGYYDDLPKKERRRAQLRYREWWDSKGKALFP